MTFLYPWLLLLLLLPLLSWWLLPVKKATGHVVVPQRTLTGLQSLRSAFAWKRSGHWIRLLAIGLGWIALVLAAAGPLTNAGQVKGGSGRDLLLAIDLSASMLEADVILDGEKVSRIDAVKAIAGAFVRGRDGDRVGLVAFADEPYLISPLTYDVEAVESFLDEVGIGLPGRRTAIGDAISLSVKQLTRKPADSRVVILLSDGNSNAGTWQAPQAAELASRHGVRVHTIGFGASSVANETALDEGSELTTIAQRSGGQYFSAESADALRSVYAELDAIEPAYDEQTARPIQRLWAYELLLITLLAWFTILLIDWRRGRL